MRESSDSDNQLEQATILLDEIEIWRTSNNCTGLKSSIATGDRQWRPVIVETDRPRISCRGLGSYIQFRFSRPPLRVMGWLQREGSLMRGFVCMLTRPHADLEKGFSRFAGGVHTHIVGSHQGNGSHPAALAVSARGCLLQDARAASLARMHTIWSRQCHGSAPAMRCASRRRSASRKCSAATSKA